MSFEIGYFFAFGDIEYLDLSAAISNGNFVIIAERHRADIIVDLRSLVQAGDLRRAARPEIQ